MSYLLSVQAIIFLMSTISSGVVLAVFFRAMFSNELRFLIYVVLFSFVADAINVLSMYIPGFYVPHVGTLYRLLELIFILEFYKKIFEFSPNTFLTRIIQIGIPLLLLFPIETRLLRILNSILFTTYAVFYFRKLIMEMKITDPLKFPNFWINSAILLYFAGSLFVFLFFDPLAQHHRMAAVGIYIFHNILLFSKNVLFAIGFSKSRQVTTA